VKRKLPSGEGAVPPDSKRPKLTTLDGDSSKGRPTEPSVGEGSSQASSAAAALDPEEAARRKERAKQLRKERRALKAKEAGADGQPTVRKKKATNSTTSASPAVPIAEGGSNLPTNEATGTDVGEKPKKRKQQQPDKDDASKAEVKEKKKKRDKESSGDGSEKKKKERDKESTGDDASKTEVKKKKKRDKESSGDGSDKTEKKKKKKKKRDKESTGDDASKTEVKKKKKKRDKESTGDGRKKKKERLGENGSAKAEASSSDLVSNGQASAVVAKKRRLKKLSQTGTEQQGKSTPSSVVVFDLEESDRAPERPPPSQSAPNVASNTAGAGAVASATAGAPIGSSSTGVPGPEVPSRPKKRKRVSDGDAGHAVKKRRTASSQDTNDGQSKKINAPKAADGETPDPEKERLKEIRKLKRRERRQQQRRLAAEVAAAAAAAAAGAPAGAGAAPQSTRPPTVAGGATAQTQGGNPNGAKTPKGFQPNPPRLSDMTLPRLADAAPSRPLPVLPPISTLPGNNDSFAFGAGSLVLPPLLPLGSDSSSQAEAGEATRALSDSIDSGMASGDDSKLKKARAKRNMSYLPGVKFLLEQHGSPLPVSELLSRGLE